MKLTEAEVQELMSQDVTLERYFELMDRAGMYGVPDRYVRNLDLSGAGPSIWIEGGNKLIAVTE